MGLIFDLPFFWEALLPVFLLLLMFYQSVTKNYNYWKDIGVPYIQPSFPFGNTKDFMLGKKHLGGMYDTFYKQCGSERFIGIYDMRRKVIVVKDPQLIKCILTKDFHHFQDRMALADVINPKTDYLAKHLFNIGGQEWKNMRVKMSPTFTSGKMKMMFLLMETCGEQLADYMRGKIKLDSVVDVKDVLARFTLDIIATCAFGLETNSLKNRDCEFYHYGVKTFQPTRLRQSRRVLFGLFSSLMRMTKARFISKDITEFYTRIIRETVDYRKKNNITRNDFLNLLLQVGQHKNMSEKELKNGNSPMDESSNDPEHDKQDSEGFTIEEITAQAFVFFVAGFETASSTISFCLYELAQHRDIQERLYQEIKEILEKHGGKPTYQALQETPYMDKVINETLRLYASLPVLNRVCTERYKVPDSDVVLEKGIHIVIPIFAIHHDPRHYEEPYKFDPERFSPERVRERHPYVHLPFGEGPRMCIGMRFGLLQTKIGLTSMLMNFDFGLTPKTQIPASLSKMSFVTQPEEPILLQLTRRR